MSIKAQLMAAVDAQTDQWTSDNPLMPNDAIVVMRRLHIEQTAELVEEMATKSGKSLSQVMGAMEKNKAAVKGLYPYAADALEFWIKKFGV